MNRNILFQDKKLKINIVIRKNNKLKHLLIKNIFVLEKIYFLMTSNYAKIIFSKRLKLLEIMSVNN